MPPVVASVNAGVEEPIQTEAAPPPIDSTAGVTGCVLIIIDVEAEDVQPSALVMVKVYDPVTSPEIVVEVPVPFRVVPPGVLVIVHVPVAGKLLRITLPVAIVHVG